jgi:transposase
VVVVVPRYDVELARNLARAWHRRRTATGEFVGLDVSLKDTAVSVRRDGKRVWRGKCASDPQALAGLIRKHAPEVERVVFETGPLSIWFYHALSAEGLPAICIDARHAKAALDMAPNKTDANDADGLAHLAEVGFYRAVRVKGYDSMLTRTMVAARGQLRKTIVQLSNQIRGLMKTFGLIVPKGAGRVFEGHVRRLLADEAALARIMLPLLEAWRSLRTRAADLERQLLAASRGNEASMLLMSIPGVGAVTASSYVAAVENPANFKSSRSVGAWLGLTTRRYQSGEVDYDGHISRRGDAHLRALLYKAVTTILTGVHAKSALRTWGLALREKVGFKRAAIAVARKLAVIMHSMLKTGQPFDRLAGAAA